MTEKEILINMIKRVSEKGHFYEEDGNHFTIFNEDENATTFEFDKDGKLIWFR